MKTTKYQKNNACTFDEFKKEIKKENKNHKNFRDLRKDRRNMWQDWKKFIKTWKNKLADLYMFNYTLFIG